MTENKDIENTKKMNDSDLDKVSGGAFFQDFSDDQYNNAGVEIVKPDSNNKGCFIFDGEKISRDEAGTIVDFYHFSSQKASFSIGSIELA